MKKALCALLATLMFVVSINCAAFAGNTDSSWENDSWDREYIHEIYFTISTSPDSPLVAKEKYSSDNVDITGYDSSRMTASAKLNKSTYREGDTPVATVTFKVDNPDDCRFSKYAAGKENVHVYGGEPTNAYISSSGKTLTVKVELPDVDEAYDPGWDPKPGPGGGGQSSGGPGVQPKGPNGAWLQDPFNGRWWYSLPNGTRPYSQWLQINNKWYWFDQLGFMGQNAWVAYQNRWYFVGPEGDMWVNRRTPDRYWVGSDGAWDGRPASY